jgi:excisionase family DNA binding protein
MTTNEWLSPAEAGAILGVGPDRVAQLAREGALKSMRTPGGHVRVRREEVEELANPPQEPSPDEPETEEAEESASEAVKEPLNPSRPKWEQVPPWKRRVREAEADVHVLELDDQRERLLEGRAERQSQRERVQAERAAEQAEAERLRQLKSRALSFLPYGVPADVQAEVARQLELGVTSQQYPAGLAREHAEALLRADVERHLRPWQTREARRDRVRDEAREREKIIGWAVFKAGIRAPQEWDYETKKALEREVRNVLEEEYHPGMNQDEATEIALNVVEEWAEDDEDDS